MAIRNRDPNNGSRIDSGTAGAVVVVAEVVAVAPPPKLKPPAGGAAEAGAAAGAPPKLIPLRPPRVPSPHRDSGCHAAVTAGPRPRRIVPRLRRMSDFLALRRAAEGESPPGREC